MPTYETSVEIAAPIALVWEVTRDIEAWPSWSPTMDEVTRTDHGPIAAGSTARVRQPKLRPVTWTVDRVADERAFDWHSAGAGYRLAATHALSTTQARTEVRLGVEMTGPLAGVLWLVIGRTARRYVDEEAAALKKRCEQ